MEPCIENLLIKDTFALFTIERLSSSRRSKNVLLLYGKWDIINSTVLCREALGGVLHWMSHSYLLYSYVAI